MFTFKHPTTVLIAGPTQCGKTYFLIQALRKNLVQPVPQRIVWVFSEWQQAYAELQREMPQIEFVKNFHAGLYESFDSRVRNMVVLDDQMENGMAHRRSTDSIAKFFTQGSHHRNLTVVYIVQNLFNQDRCMRTVSLNAHYLIVFKNPRDVTQIHTLASQMYPGNMSVLLDAFKDATATPTGGSETRGYLLLDLHPTSCDALRILTNVFDEHPTAYVPREYINAPKNCENVSTFRETDGSFACTSGISSNQRAHSKRIKSHARQIKRVTKASSRKQTFGEAHRKVLGSLSKSEGVS